MGCVQKIGSFPNARNRSKPPTTTASTYRVDAIFDVSPGPIDLLDAGLENSATAEAAINQKTINGNTIVTVYDPLLTYLTLRNADPTQPIFYGYVLKGESDQGIDLIQSGMILKAGDSVDIEAPACTLIARSGSSSTSDVDCRIDRGRSQ